MTSQCIFEPCTFPVLVPEKVMLFEADHCSRACQQHRTLQHTRNDTAHVRTECLHGNDADQKTETVTRLSREAVNILKSAGHLRNVKPHCVHVARKIKSVGPHATKVRR
jgi:hypothetical protein